jgi:pimeloyl-ACP methyl ester carboxylesterase
MSSRIRLAAPAAITMGRRPPTDPRELAGILYHHPERQPPGVAPSEAVASKQRALVDRLIGPPRDPELEAAMRELQIPTLVMFGTEDRLTPPELGRHYRDLLPHCHLVIVYDAAHAIDCDRPEAFAALVSDFLEHHEQFVVRRQSGLLYS